LSVRPATEDDIPLLVELGEKFHALSDEGGEFCPATFAKFLSYLMQEGCVFVSKRGMLGGLAWPSPWSKDYLIAMESFWWAEDGQGRALANAFEAWAEAKGAKSLRMGFLYALAPEKVERMLKMRGYQPLETIMVK